MPCIVAHRGASGLVTHGNTIDAFDAAVAIGCDWVELDVRITRDGTLVVHHDAVIRGVSIRDLDVEDAQQAAKQDGHDLQMLHDVLERYAQPLCFDIELKEGGYESLVLDTVRKTHAPDRVVFTSFLESSVARLRTLAPECRTGLLLGQEIADLFPRQRLIDCKASFAVPHRSMLGLGMLRRLRSMSLPVWVWTVNQPEPMRALMEEGVEGLITDRPDLALAMRTTHRARMQTLPR